MEVDISTGKIDKYLLSEDVTDVYIGGRGINAYLIGRYLFKNRKNRIDPLGKDNLILISVGPVSGSLIPNTGRVVISSISPITGGLFDSHFGGFIGVAMKRYNIDTILIKGSSNKNKILVIGEQIYFKDFERDLSVPDTLRLLEEIYPHSRKIVTGNASEKLSIYANVFDDTYRAAGRGGIGAVFGSKGLKAIIFEFTGEYQPRKTKKIVDIALMTDYMLSTSAIMRREPPFREIPDSETRKKMHAYIMGKKQFCYNCNLPCGKLRASPMSRAKAFRPPADLDTLIRIYELTDRAGVDRISTVAIYDYMKNKNLISSEDIEDIVSGISYGSGPYHYLREGAVKKYPDIENLHGLETPPNFSEMPETAKKIYLTSNRAFFHHLESFGDAETNLKEACTYNKQIDIILRIQNIFAMIDSLIMCIFTAHTLDYMDYHKIYRVFVQNYNKNKEKLFFEAGKNIWNLEHYINQHLLDMNKGTLDNEHPDFIKEYYIKRGWDEYGYIEKRDIEFIESLFI